VFALIGRRIRTFFCPTGLLLTALSLSACMSIDITPPRDPTDGISDHTARIRLGQMERAAVRGVLGDPLYASAYWKFDLFRDESAQTMVPIVLTPWPVPFGRMKDALYRYTLVAYDPAGQAKALATGLFRKPTEFRRTAPIENDHSALHLRAGKLMFYVDPEWERRENLLIAPEGRNEFLQYALAMSSCTVVVGCGDHGCGDQLAVDGGPVRRLPLRLAHSYWMKAGIQKSWLVGAAPADSGTSPWLETVVAVRLSPGEHVLRFSSRHLGGEHDTPLSCSQGEVVYLVVNATDNERMIKRALVDWQVERFDRMPDRFVLRPLTIIFDGEWMIDTEPAH
jgi:hypothetical protein